MRIGGRQTREVGQRVGMRGMERRKQKSRWSGAGGRGELHCKDH